MRQAITICALSTLALPPSILAESPHLTTEIQTSLEYNELNGLSLGSDRELEQLIERDYELEIDLEYRPSNSLGLFLTAALIDETERLAPIDLEQSRSGSELKELGLSYLFGDRIQHEIKLGRIEYESSSQWWSLWDDELDSFSLQSRAGDIESLLVFAEEQLPESTADDFIEPELDDLERLLLNLSWEVADGHSVEFYYLRQRDNSSNYSPGDSIAYDRIDEEDADLSWRGISYIAELENDTIGSIDLELHYTAVRGRSILYELEDPESGYAEVAEFTHADIDGQAYGFHARWSPDALDRLTLIVAGATGSGDSTKTGNTNESYRQTGIQGDLESYGELFQPELSNLNIGLLGLEWQASSSLSVALLHYDYRQNKLADEIRDASIEADPSGTSRDLGTELDLVLSLEHEDTLELYVTYARFKAGKAYDSAPDKSSRFIGVDISYNFH